MKIEKRQTTITFDTEEFSTIENAIVVINDLVRTLEEEHETILLGRNGQEITYDELSDMIDILDAIIWAKGEFTIS